MIEYTVKVLDDGTKFWYLNGKLHRVGGPAIEEVDGTKHWYLNGKEFTKQSYIAITTQKTITINGVKYKLVKE